MKKFPIILDLETQHTFREFKNAKDLKISIAVIYDYKDHSIKTFFEKDISGIFPILESSSYIIGYNINTFDMEVLSHYYPSNMNHFHTFDILDEIRNNIGRRLALNDVIYATLNKRKTGHGLQAIDFFKENKWEELKKYCSDDVMLTKELFEYGVNNGEIYYLDENGKSTIKVNWKKYLEEEKSNDMPLTLPF